MDLLALSCLFIAALSSAAYYLPSLAARFSLKRGAEEHFASKAAMYSAYSIFFIVSFAVFISSPAPSLLNFLGIPFALAGIALHFFALRSLGPSYSAGTEFKPGGGLVTRGVYGFCRHPIYSAAGLFFTGLSLMLFSAASLASLALVFAYLSYRIRVEERLLRRRYGRAYAVFAKKVPSTVFGAVAKVFSKARP